jgi:hypothetical protein
MFLFPCTDSGNVVFDVFCAVQTYLGEEPIHSTPSAPQEEKQSVSLELDRHVNMSRVIFWTRECLLCSLPSHKQDIQNLFCPFRSSQSSLQEARHDFVVL